MTEKIDGLYKRILGIWDFLYRLETDRKDWLVSKLQEDEKFKKAYDAVVILTSTALIFIRDGSYDVADDLISIAERKAGLLGYKPGKGV